MLPPPLFPTFRILQRTIRLGAQSLRVCPKSVRWHCCARSCEEADSYYAGRTTLEPKLHKINKQEYPSTINPTSTHPSTSLISYILHRLLQLPFGLKMLSNIFLALLSLSFATALPTDSHLDKRQSNASGPFTLIAAHSGSPIHLQAINANNGSFWIGKPPLTYCPAPPVPPADCPPGTETALNVENGECGLVSIILPNAS